MGLRPDQCPKKDTLAVDEAIIRSAGVYEREFLKKRNTEWNLLQIMRHKSNPSNTVNINNISCIIR